MAIAFMLAFLIISCTEVGPSREKCEWAIEKLEYLEKDVNKLEKAINSLHNAIENLNYVRLQDLIDDYYYDDLDRGIDRIIESYLDVEKELEELIQNLYWW